MNDLRKETDMSDLTEANLAFVAGDTERAAELYYQCARDGDARASFNLAHCLRRGIGVPMDPLRAIPS